MNGYELGDQIIFDLVLANHIGNFPNADGSMPDAQEKVSRLTRITLDLGENGGSVVEQALDDIYVDFVMPDPRWQTLPYQVGFAGAVLDPAENPIGWNAVVRYDMRDVSRVGYSFGPGTGSWEPLFIPRSPDAAEGDGWLIAMVFRAATGTCELAILDSAKIAEGPVATIALPHRVPFGFHGAFVAA
jgi:carotenoid cleavage dioxygenase